MISYGFAAALAEVERKGRFGLSLNSVAARGSKCVRIFFLSFYQKTNCLTFCFDEILSFYFLFLLDSPSVHRHTDNGMRMTFGYHDFVMKNENIKRKTYKWMHSPLLLLSSIGPLESLSLSSWRCKWWAAWWWWWWRWWWLNDAKLWCKWCKWLLLLWPLLLLLFALAVALRSRGLCGDGDRPFSTRSRAKCSAELTLPPPPPRMSVIIKRERDGRTAIEPRCMGTVMPPFDVNSSAELLIVVVLVGLSPDECHWSTILTKYAIQHNRNVKLFLSLYSHLCTNNGSDLHVRIDWKWKTNQRIQYRISAMQFVR